MCSTLFELLTALVMVEICTVGPDCHRMFYPPEYFIRGGGGGGGGGDNMCEYILSGRIVHILTYCIGYLIRHTTCCLFGLKMSWYSAC